MKSLLIATTNKGKILELRALLADFPVQLLTPADINLNLDVLEDGLTYAENAAKKATAFARASGLASLADDSGLEVAALNGAPGLFSARYSSKPGATDADRRAYLLQNILATSAPRPWLARFVATVAVSSPEGKPEGKVEFAEGECAGEILPKARGTGGFGYDPLFLFPHLGLTMAELSDEKKNHISHRARAIQAAMPILLRWMSQ